MGRITKNQKAVAEKYDSSKLYTLAEACEMLKDITYTKFDSTVEITTNLGLDGIVHILVLIADDELGLLVTNRHRHPFGERSGSLFLCQEAGHPGDVVADDKLKFRAKLGLDKNITRIKQPFDHFPFAVLSHNLALDRNEYLSDLVPQVEPLDLFLKILGGLLLFASSCP